VEMAKKLEEKDRALEEQLVGEKRRLDEILEGKEEEKRRLEEELSGAKSESERVKAEDMGRARDDIMANLAGLMESELQCGICTEVFVKVGYRSTCSLCLSCTQWQKCEPKAGGSLFIYNLCIGGSLYGSLVGADGSVSPAIWLDHPDLRSGLLLSLHVQVYINKYLF